ncbi:MAG: hypothetical protein IBX72_05825 [Nitrospirae bacterium]|jgi:hypothetical protein|nr:hypothetical protein [Nitrospirota bacterium]
MNRPGFSLLLCLVSFLFLVIPAVAVGSASEIEELKNEIRRLQQQEQQLKRDMEELLNRIEDLEKKQAETRMKTVETEKKIEEVEKKAERVIEADAELTRLEEKAGILDKMEDTLKKLEDKTRIKLSGEIRFRADATFADTPADFVYPGIPDQDKDEEDYNSWPMRFRLNLESSVIPEYLDIYGRLTLNKRFGNITYIGAGDNPHDWMNSWAAHQSGDITPRLENFYAVAKPPYLYYNEILPTKLIFGRLPGYEGPPTRSSNTIFPRLFVDSEIEGGLINVELPKLPFEDTFTELRCNLLGEQPEPTETEKERKFSRIARSNYFKKLKERNELYIGYLKYADQSLSGPGGKFENLMGIDGKGPDSNVFISQLQLKLTEDTQVFFNYAYMDNYYMPRYTFYTSSGHTFKGTEPYTDGLKNELVVPYIEPEPYHLGGIWLDTQIWRFQVYGAFYYSHFKIAPHKHRWTFSEEGLAALQTKGVDPEDPQHGYERVGDRTYEKFYEGDSFPGRAWFVGFNTGNLINDKVVFWFDVTWGSDYWINPFNVKGYRRKGTVHYLSNNYFYNQNFSKDQIAVGYYPFHSRVIDTCVTYYLSPRTYLLLGTMYFNHNKRDLDDTIIGSSGRKSYWYPHLEWKIFF